jgi:hypothetical protein
MVAILITLPYSPYEPELTSIPSRKEERYQRTIPRLMNAYTLANIYAWTEVRDSWLTIGEVRPSAFTATLTLGISTDRNGPPMYLKELALTNEDSL